MINGIQQIGIGVINAKAVFNWYRKNLGFNIKVFEDTATARLMLQYTGGIPRERYAILALNLRGGGGLEIWQFKNQTPKPPTGGGILLGDTGINAMKLRSTNISQSRAALLSYKELFISPVFYSEHGGPSFFFKDPWNNIVQVVENTYSFSNARGVAGGVLGATVGVSEMEGSLVFYRNILGYEVVVSDTSGVFPEFSGLKGGDNTFRRVLLMHKKRDVGGFGELFGPSEIELIQVLDRKPVPIYNNRFWGDLGYIHLCFDIRNMKQLQKDCEQMGHPFTVDSAKSFDMGQAAGHFSYIEDPDGALIEFVETYKVPIFKRLGLFIDLKKRDPGKPLPRWMVNSLRIHRVTKDL